MPLLIMLGIIFCFSAQNADTSSQLSGDIVEELARFIAARLPFLGDMSSPKTIKTLTVIVRKTAHFCEYAFLAFLCCLHVYYCGRKHTVLLSGAFGMVYAVSDELHQLFSEGRAARLLDVCIDTTGAFTGALVMLLLIWAAHKIKEKKADIADPSGQV